MKIYDYKEVYDSTLNYFNGDELATNVWITKYAKSELLDNGNTIYYEKTPDDMFHRIASEIARAGMKYNNPLSEEEVYNLIKDYKYILFAGRPMAGIGVDDAVSISNCFVVGRPGQDSYGTIATIDQEIMQLSKRGGGCVWEDTSVIIKDRGIVPIKDVNVGEYILSFNVVNHKDEWKLIKDKYYTDVKLEDQIEVEYSNGTRLKTSKRHPILCLSKEGYGYKSFNDGYSIGSTNKAVTNSEFVYRHNENDNIAWLIGHHIGDGTIGGTNSKHKNRIRIIGDNEEVIEKYAEILSKITGSNSTVKESTQKRYKTKVWEYSSKNDNNHKFIELIDNQVGLKTYTCFIPKIIKDNNLYVPFIAGLIDADGSVDKRKGRIELSLCSKMLIREISEYLSFNGQPYHIKVKKSKRNNEKEIYRLVIPNRAPIVKAIREYLVHPQKIERLNIISNKLHSKVIELTNNEIAKIENFNGTNIVDVKVRKLFYNNRANCRKRNGKMAVPGLQLCYNLGIFTYEEYNEIISRLNTVNIIDDNSQKLNYIDIEVEDNNNYYAGEYGFVNIHNCGTDLSDFRAAGSKVHNAARTSSGPVEICATRFSNTIREVGQNGRRGALMLSMDITHPSAEEFMDAKMEDGKITGANISMKLYDDWMKSALGIDCEMDKEKNRLWKKIIHNATTKAEPGVLFWDTILRESPADCYSDFGFKTISTNPCFPASEYLLTDKGYVKFGDLYKYGENNVVMTDNRISYVETQEVETPEQWQIDENNRGVTPRNASNVFLTKKNAEIAELVFTNGSKLRCTPDHHIATLNRGMVEAKDLTSDDNVLVGLGNIGESIKDKMPETTEEILALLCGLIMGDGSISINKKQERCHLSFWGEDSFRMTDICVNLINILHERCGVIKGSNLKPLSKYFISTKGVNGVSKTTITSAYLGQLLKKYFNYTKVNKHIVPEYIMNNASTNIGKFFIAGFMYCDGSISGNLNKGVSVRLHQSNLELLRQMQMMLNSNGFYSTIKLRRKAQMKRMSDGHGGYKEYFTKANYDLIITAIQAENYINNIGFFGDVKKEGKFLEFAQNKRVIKAYTNLESYTLRSEREDVYCIKEPVTRSIIVNNISTRRCGEIPLAAGDACRLMSLNLYSYVDYPFTNEARFNFEKFINHAKLSIKLMDNMIDLENEKIDKILAKIETDPEDDDIKAIEKNLWIKVKHMNEYGRRSGIGFTALGDMLAALGIKYGTQTATIFVEYLQKIMATAVYIGSCDLVQVDGRPAFGCFNYNLEKDNPFLVRLTYPFVNTVTPGPVMNLCNEFTLKWPGGRRNIALLTCAPAGSLSTQSQTTSGLEPVFMISYRRRRKIDKNSGIKPDFIDKTGDAFIEFNVVHHKFIVWYSIHKNISFNEAKANLEKMSDSEIQATIKNSPYYKATAMDCDWHERINMQAALQKYVDHSLSVTCNLPKGTTEEVVEDVYRTAWESGCKGCTIYVDGSRDGVLINKDEKKKCECNEFIETNTPKRPKKLPCKIIKFSNKGVKWIAAVGLYEGKPYEIFTGLAEKLNIPNGIDNGFIIRNKVPKEILNEDTGMNEIVKVSRYDIEFNINGESKIIEGLSSIFNEEYWNYGKLISGLLRHGMPVNYVVKVITSMDFKNDGINSWKSGVIRALKTFMKDEDLHEPCPNCGGHLRRESGCIQCTDCGWSKCGAN